MTMLIALRMIGSAAGVVKSETDIFAKHCSDGIAAW